MVKLNRKFDMEDQVHFLFRKICCNMKDEQCFCYPACSYGKYFLEKRGTVGSWFETENSAMYLSFYVGLVHVNRQYLELIMNKDLQLSNIDHKTE